MRELCELSKLSGKKLNLRNAKPKFELILSQLDKDQRVMKQEVKWIYKDELPLSLMKAFTLLEVAIEEYNNGS